MNKEDFNVHVDENGNLVIAMEKKCCCKDKDECKDKEDHKEKEKKSRYLRREFSYTKFQQTLILPEDVVKDTIKASMNDGVLSIELPRKSPDSKNNITKVIEIK
jgi:HSP20 family protein